MRKKNILGTIATAVVLSGCQIPAAMIATSHGAMPVTRYVPPTHDVPPQVVYRLDNHRYVTLENYSSCTGDGIVYYNDTTKGIRTRVQYGALTYLGKLHIDSNGGFLAFPDAPGPSPYTCGDRGCYMSINYSMDSGKTFERMSGWRLTSPQIEAYEETKNLTVSVKEDQLYIITKTRAVQWKLDKDDHPEMPQRRTLEGGPSQVPKISTPFGQDRYSCDDTLRPKAKK